MPLYVADKKVEKVYRGELPIEKIMQNDVNVISEGGLLPTPEIDTVLFESSTAGVYNITLPVDGNYEVYCIGGGSGCACTHASYYYAASGGSGAGFIGVVQLSKGNYILQVGKGGGEGTAFREDSYGFSGDLSYLKYGNTYLIRSYAGSSTQVSYTSASSYSFYPGKGGSKPSITLYTPSGEEASLSSLVIVSTTLHTDGKAGSKGYSSSPTVLGGAPVDGTYTTGHGAGGGCHSGTPSAGKPGYVKIIYKG